MAEFHGIFCRPFLQSVMIIGGGMGSRVGWCGMGRGGVGWEVAKTLAWDTP